MVFERVWPILTSLFRRISVPACDGTTQAMENYDSIKSPKKNYGPLLWISMFVFTFLYVGVVGDSFPVHRKSLLHLVQCDHAWYCCAPIDTLFFPSSHAMLFLTNPVGSKSRCLKFVALFSGCVLSLCFQCESANRRALTLLRLISIITTFYRTFPLATVKFFGKSLGCCALDKFF